MRKAPLVLAALALAASLPAPAQAEAVHRRHIRTHVRRAVPPPAPLASAVPVAPSNDPVGSEIDRTTAGIARASAASRAVTLDAFGPILRTIYPPGESGRL